MLLQVNNFLLSLWTGHDGTSYRAPSDQDTCLEHGGAPHFAAVYSIEGCGQKSPLCIGGQQGAEQGLPGPRHRAHCPQGPAIKQYIHGETLEYSAHFEF